MPLWRGIFVKHRDNFTFTYQLTATFCNQWLELCVTDLHSQFCIT